MSSKKISDFPASTTLPGDTELTFVADGVNYKIDLASFNTALGVTGTLSQEGDVLGIPILNTQGADNFIRNIEPGIGIAAEISAEGGIALSTSITSSTAGAPVLKIGADNSVVGVGFIAGGGISISADSGTGDITVSNTDAPTSTKTVIVSGVADFPAAVGGVITLADDTEYLLVNDVSTSNRFVLGSKNSIRSGSLTLTELEYTGVDNMFTGTNTQLKIFGMDLSCPNGSLFDIDGAGTVFQLVETNIDCDSGGVIDGVSLVRMNGVSWSSITTSGVSFAGTINSMLVEEQVILDLNGIFLDLASAVFTNIILDRVVVQNSQAGSFLVSGLIDSGNIAVGGFGSVSLNRFSGDGDPLENISPDNIRWGFAANNLISDTSPGALVSVSGNATVTTITTQNVPVKVAATWTVNSESWFSGDTTGRITYEGESPYRGAITFSCSIIATSGGLIGCVMYVAINGSVVAVTGKAGTVSAAASASITGIWDAEFQPGDYVEVWVANPDNTTNYVMSQGILRVT